MKTRKIIVCYNNRISAKFPKVIYEQIILGILFAMILKYVVNAAETIKRGKLFKGFFAKIRPFNSEYEIIFTFRKISLLK